MEGKGVIVILCNSNQTLQGLYSEWQIWLISGTLSACDVQAFWGQAPLRFPPLCIPMQNAEVGCCAVTRVGIRLLPQPSSILCGHPLTSALLLSTSAHNLLCEACFLQLPWGVRHMFPLSLDPFHICPVFHYPFLLETQHQVGQGIFSV